MTTKINFDTVLNLLNDLVKEYGSDYKYEQPTNLPLHASTVLQHVSCFYVHDDEKPACIIGKMLHRLGVSIDELKKYEGTSGVKVCESIFGDETRFELDGTINTDFSMLVNPTNTYNVHLTRLIELTQKAQDNGASWGMAVAQGYFAAHNMSMVILHEGRARDREDSDG